VPQGWAVKGKGRSVQFIAKRLVRDDQPLSLGHAALLAVYLLVVAKKHVDQVDGASQISILTDRGWLSRDDQTDEIAVREQFFEWFDAALSHAYLSFADTGITEQEFDQAWQEFTATVKTLRKNYFEEFKNSWLSRAISDPSIKVPYRILPQDTTQKFGNRKVKFKFDTQSPTGTSGFPSFSPSASTSPSSSASPSSDGENETES